MSTIHFRIDEEIKRLAMLAAERKKTTLTDVMRKRAEELAAEELRMQSTVEDVWLEAEIAQAFSRFETGDTLFISDEDAASRMAALRTKAAREER